MLGGRYLTEKELKPLGFRALGNDVRVHERASVYGAENISIASHVRIDDYAVIIATGPVCIGSFVSVHNFCFLGGSCGISIGNFVTLAPGSKLFSSSDDYSGDHLTGVVVPRHLTGGVRAPVQLGDHVIVGAGSVVLPGCILGDGVAVGALSLVKTDLAPWSVFGGVPAKKLGPRSRNVLATVAANPKFFDCIQKVRP